MKGNVWDARIERARELGSAYPFASEGLRFYERIAVFQKSLFFEIEAACGAGRMPCAPGSLRNEFDSFLLLPRFGPFLSLVREIAPEALSQGAQQLAARGGSRWQDLLMQFWEAGTAAPAKLEPREALLSWIFLQPYAEYLSSHAEWTPPAGTPPVCPLCGGKPQTGALRPEGEGGKRFLICALCSLEWEYRRIVCPSCGEEDVHKLAVYTAKEFGAVRVEACDTCDTYLKTVDLTKDGRAVPVVDELATLPLDLWAVEQGYRKLQSNILGV